MNHSQEGHERRSLMTTGQSHVEFDREAFQYPTTPNEPKSIRKMFQPGTIRKNRNRAIFKNGDCNIYPFRISKFGIRFLHDIFTSLVDIHWRWTLIVFGLAYFVSWLFFALIWWLIMFTHGDLEDEHLPQNQAESNWTPCVLNIQNFTSCYLFSIETQYTIGYGVRTTTEECPEAIFIMSVQAITAMMIDAFFIGIVFAKMTRPKLRIQTLLFSRNAVISVRDDVLCLIFRVGDMRKNPLIGANIRAQLIKPKVTKEGEVISNYTTELEVHADGCGGDIFFLWPMTVVHKIDEDSPLYHLSATEMLQDQFEIAVVLEGTVESTGQSIQARSSYVASEILWGYRFEPMLSETKDEHAYEINYSKFDNVYPVDTPLCSGAELEEFNKMEQESEESKQSPEPLLVEGVLRPPPPIPSRNRNQQRSYSYDNALLEFGSSYV